MTTLDSIKNVKTAMYTVNRVVNAIEYLHKKLPGIPRIMTISERIRTIIADLFVKIAKNRPNVTKEIRKYSQSIAVKCVPD